ncbi:MAG: helix-turn-helix transcriptional regulator [Clostridia bacterium]|nr:helix-turn-helix transcriptional regulator [Clostridia bacterium]
MYYINELHETTSEGGDKMREWMREARTKKQMTLKELGDKLHISESYCCAIEKGTRQSNLDLSLANGLSKHLGLSIKTILHEEEKLRRAMDMYHHTTSEGR